MFSTNNMFVIREFNDLILNLYCINISSSELWHCLIIIIIITPGGPFRNPDLPFSPRPFPSPPSLFDFHSSFCGDGVCGPATVH